NVYLRAARELTQKLDHEPAHEEIANLLEKPGGEAKGMLRLNERMSAGDVSRGPGSDKTRTDSMRNGRGTETGGGVGDGTESSGQGEGVGEGGKAVEVGREAKGVRGERGCERGPGQGSGHRHG
ncbi:hypothetical protein B1218_35520, partial [Pseudomonas ogarae]